MFEVLRIKPHETHEWLKRKHYAKRVPSIMFAYGLFKQNWLVGVITYGNCANNNLNEIAGCRAMELNRLCIDEDAPRNAASMLVGRSLAMLPQPYAIVSYADQGQGHVGYVYQATNWIYTGIGSGDTEFRKDGRTWHRKALYSRYGTGSKDELVKRGYEPVKVEPKHRYVFFCGDRRERRKMLKNLEWPQMEYPKGETTRYDASYRPATQGLLIA